MTVYDIAGLTKGSASGAGLGNAFLSHIRAVDAIFQVVRCFDDAEIVHIEGDVNPTRDLDIISHELRLKDIEFVEKAHENLTKQTRRGGQSLEMKKLREEQATVEKILEMLKEGKDVRKGDWAPKEVNIMSSFLSRPLPYFVMTKSNKLDIIPALRMPRQQNSRRGRLEKKSQSDQVNISLHELMACLSDPQPLTLATSIRLK